MGCQVGKVGRFPERGLKLQLVSKAYMVQDVMASAVQCSAMQCSAGEHLDIWGAVGKEGFRGVFVCS